MPVPATSPSTQLKDFLPSLRDREPAPAFWVLDWTNLNSAPSPVDIPKMTGFGQGTSHLAVVVNSPRMLRAATVFAEQAGLRGAQVRVFVDATEAKAWLCRGLHSAALTPR